MKYEALTIGHGPRLLEIFLEPTCPFSAKTYLKLPNFVELAGEDQVTTQIHLISQPWHMYSGVIVRAILAASTLSEGCEKAMRILRAVALNREEYEFEDHCCGANLDVTPRQLLHKLRNESEVDFLDAFMKKDLDAAVKRHTKYGRQNGIHVSPTFMLDGLIRPSMSSGDTIEQWKSELERD